MLIRSAWRRLSRKPQVGSLQYTLDMYRLAYLMYLREGMPGEEMNDDIVNKYSMDFFASGRFRPTADGKGGEANRNFVQENITKQMQHILTSEHRTFLEMNDEGGAGEESAASSEGDGGGADLSLTEEQQEERRLPYFEEAATGFQLELEQSSIPDAGDGVFLRGSVSQGTVVAMYPGLVVLPEFIKQYAPIVQSSDKEYLTARFDNILLDAHVDVSQLSSSSAAVRDLPGYLHDEEGAAKVFGSRFNSLAVGHYINHPPPRPRTSSEPSTTSNDVEAFLQSTAQTMVAREEEVHLAETPNVMVAPWDVPLSFPNLLLPYLPNRYYRPPVNFLNLMKPDCLMHALVFVALRDIEDGEELFVNYRMNPSVPRPHWYYPVDVEEDLRRWSSESAPEFRTRPTSS